MAAEQQTKYLDSCTIERTKEIISPGDFVMLKKRTLSKMPKIAKVEEIEFIPDLPDDPFITVRLYSWPEEILGCLPLYIGKDEVFHTDRYFVISQYSILGKCFVHTTTDYFKLKKAGKVEKFHLYCRYGYKTEDKSFVPKTFSVFCCCRQPYNPDRFMVKCNKCRQIFHPTCLGMTDEQAQKQDPFFCLNCSCGGVTISSQNEFPESSIKKPQVDGSERVHTKAKWENDDRKVLPSKHNVQRRLNVSKDLFNHWIYYPLKSVLTQDLTLLS